MEKPDKNPRDNTDAPGAPRDKTDTSGRIELRSENVRRLIGEIPPSLVRWGTAIIALIFLALLAAVALLPYPYSSGESILRHFLG